MPKDRLGGIQSSEMCVHSAHRLTVSIFKSGIREEIDTGLWDVCRQKGG